MKILLALLVLASNAFAGIAAGTVVLYPMENSTADTSGNGYDFTCTGCSFSNLVAKSGSYSLSPTAGNSGTAAGALPAGAVTAIKGLHAWSWEADVNKVVRTANTYILMDDPIETFLQIGDGTSDNLSFAVAQTDRLNYAYTGLVNTGWHNLAVVGRDTTGGGNKKEIWLDGAIVASDGSAGTYYGNPVNIYLSYTGAPRTWYMDNVRWSSVARTGFPTTDPPDSTPTFTATKSPTFTSTQTPTFTQTITPTFSDTPTASPTSTATPTPSFSNTITPSITPTASISPTFTISPTPSMSPTPGGKVSEQRWGPFLFSPKTFSPHR